jgi:hypothetical protein
MFKQEDCLFFFLYFIQHCFNTILLSSQLFLLIPRLNSCDTVSLTSLLCQEVRSEAELTVLPEGEEEDGVEEKDPEAEDFSNIKVKFR